MSDVALTYPAPNAWALSERRYLRRATIFLLYVAQGLPLGLLDFAMPAWLAQNGASAAAIGSVLAMTILPWTLKLAHGFVMDRYTFLAMGRRRPWIIASQFGLVAGFIALALANPSVHQIALISAFAFTISLFASMQDVAVDGLAVDILEPDEIARVNGFMFGGQMIGIAAGGALGGYCLAYYGLPAAALVLAVIAGMILCLIASVRERSGEKLLPWSNGSAVQRNLDLQRAAFWPIIRDVFKAMTQRETLKILPAFVATSAAFGVFLGLGPLFAVDYLDWQKDTYSGWVSQASLVAGLAGIVLCGPLAEFAGPRRALLGTFGGFFLFGLAMLALEPQWGNALLFIPAIFTIYLLRTQSLVAVCSLSMPLCVPAVAATQFGLLMAVANLGRTISAAMLGWLDSLGGYSAMFLAIAGFSLVGAGFALVARVGR